MSALEAEQIPRQRRWISRRAFKLGVALLVIFAALCAVWAARERLIAPFLISRARELVRQATGLELRVAGIGGNWWNELEIRGLEFAGPEPSGELRSLEVGRVHARYDLLALVMGDPQAVEAVEIDAAKVAIDLDRPSASPRPRSPSTQSPQAFPWPKFVPAIALRDSSVSLVAAGTRFDASGLNLAATASSADGSSTWELRAAQGSVDHARLGRHAGTLSARVEYHAGVFELPSFEFDGRTLARQLRCDLRGISSGDASFAGWLDVYGGPQEFSCAIGASDLNLWFDTHDLELVPLLGDLRGPSTIRGRVSVGGMLRLPFDSPAGWSAYAWGKVEDFAFEDRAIDLATFAGSFDADRADLREAAFVRGANSLRLTNFGFSLELLELDDILRSLSGSAELEVFDPRAISTTVSAEVKRAADRVQRAALAVNFRPRGFEVLSGVVETDLGGLAVQRGRATWGPRDLPWYEGLSLDVDSSLAFDDIAPLAALFAQGEASGALKGTVTLRGPVLRPSGNFLLEGDRLRLSGFEIGHVNVDARADKQHLEVMKLEVDGGLGKASASGNFDYSSGVISKGKVIARTAALAKLSGERAAADSLTIEASIEGKWNSPAVEARIKAAQLAFQGRSVESLDFAGSYAEGCVKIEQLSGSVDSVLVHADGNVCRDKSSGAWRVALEHARLAREALDLALEAPLEVELSPEKVVVQGLRVAGSAGRAVADISWSEKAQRISIDASELYPMELLRPFLYEGVEIEGVQGTLSLVRTPQTLEADASLSVAKLRLYADSPLASVAFRGKLADRELVIAELALMAPGHYAVNVNGRVPTDPLAGEWISEGPLELYGGASISDLEHLPWQALGLESRWKGEVRAQFRLDGESSSLRGIVDAKADVTRTSTDPMLDRAQLNALQFEGRATLGDELRLDNARFAMPGLASAIIDGKLGVRLSPRDWVREKKLDWRAFPADIRAVVTAQDLGFVAGLSSALRRTGGTLEGELRVQGSLGEPEASGVVDLSRGEVRMANALAPFENMSAHVEFDKRGVRIVSLGGEYGAAPFTAGGVVELGFDEPRLDVHVEGKGLLLAREEGLRLRADAELKLAGPLSALSLGGKIVLVEGRFSKDFALITLPGSSKSRRTRSLELPFLRRAPWANIEFDVGVVAKTPIRIETNIARGTVDPDLTLRGNGAAPRLGGTVTIGSARVKLPAASVEVTSGVLTFRGEHSLAPTLDITAVTRVRGYDITAQISGTSVEPELLFTSSPPLSSEDLAVLILTGQLPESALSAQGGGAAAQTVVVYLGSDIMTRWLGGPDAGEDPISERFEFYQGTEVSQSGIEATEFIFRLTPNPKGKRTIVYLRAEQDIYERFNYGVKFLFRFR